MSRFMKIVVVNGSRKGMVNVLGNIPRSSSSIVLKVNITEKQLYDLKSNYSGVRSYYLYDPTDLNRGKINDVECPNLSLYDDFIDITARHN